jgi:hypothetical protein
MLNFFKLKEGAFSFFMLVTLVIGILWGVSQVFAYLGVKQYAKETKTIEYVIEKEGKVFRKTYDVTAHVDEDGEFYNPSITVHGDNK